MRAIPYKDALLWILKNDDTSFLDDEDHEYLSVTASCIADIYRVDDSILRKDLLKLRKKNAK